MNALDEINPAPPAWKPKDVAVSDSEDEDSSSTSSSSDVEGLDSFDANPSESRNEFDFDDDSFVATAEDVAAWEAGLAAPPRPRHRELRLADGGRYAGETLGGLRHGRGTLECPNGDKYEGGWRLGLRHGKGKAVFPSRKVSKEGGEEGEDVSYDGDWVDDKADGDKINRHGRAAYENGGVYEGAFSGGVRCGWGRHTFPLPAAAASSSSSTSSSSSAAPPPLPRPYYEGEWLDDAPHGQGVHSCPVGGTFVGTWERGSRSRGCWTSADGEEEYEGDWAVVDVDAEEKSSHPLDPLTAAVRHGKGTCTLRGVSKYSGDWARGEPSGRGECRYADGSVFAGGWRRGRRHGPAGELRRADGSFYRGDWRDGREHGRGRALLPSGDEYEGEWREGLRHGKGKGTCGPRSEDSYDGEWRAGVRHGAGRCVFGNGDVYEGQWEEGQRHGMGSCVFKEDGVWFEGVWQRGRWVQGAADAALSEPVSSSSEEKENDDGAGCPRHRQLDFLRAIAGRRSAFRIRARDSKGQPRLSGGDCFSAWVECGVSGEAEGDGERGEDSKKAIVDPARAAKTSSPPFERVDARVTDRGDGTYDVSYVPRVAGEARLHISLLSSSFSSSSPQLSSSSSASSPPSSSSPPAPSFVPVADSPYTLLIEPGPPQKRQELVMGLPREIVRRGGERKNDDKDEEEEEAQRVTFWVQPRDEFGNACGPCPLAFAVASAVARFGAGGGGGEGVSSSCSPPTGSGLEVRAETRQLPDGRVECSFPAAAFAKSCCPLGRGVVEVMVVDGSSSQSAGAPRHARGSPFSLNAVADAATDSPSTSSDAPAAAPPASSSSSSSSSSSAAAAFADAHPPVEDKAAAWNRAAEEAFLAVDGDATGWDSDDDGSGGKGARRRNSKAAAAAARGGGDEDSAESLAAAHPGVPIVERLEDIWQVAKLHRERREKEEREKKKNRKENEGDEGEEEQHESDDDDALGAAQVAAKAAEDASRAAVVAAAAAADQSQKVV